MLGHAVEVDGVKVFVSCSPSTRHSEILRRAAQQIERWESEANHKTHAAEIAWKFGIEYALT